MLPKDGHTPLSSALQSLGWHTVRDCLPGGPVAVRTTCYSERPCDCAPGQPAVDMDVAIIGLT